MTEPTIQHVHTDARGSMYAINIGDRELMLLFSRKGTIRGGHSHSVPEGVMVLTGEMVYKKRPLAISPLEETLVDGDFSYNKPGEIHMGEFLEDTWLIEWKVCKDKNSWKQENYAPWRELVEANIRDFSTVKASA